MASAALVAHESGLFSFKTPASDRAPYDVVFRAPTEHNWSLTQLYDSEVPPRHAAEFRERLGKTLALRNIRTAYAPTVRHMSGVVLNGRKFTDETPLSCGVRILRPSHPCDGVPLERFGSFLMSAGGCLLLVLSGSGLRGPVCIAAHAGRNSLVDMYLILKNKPSRSDHSIVNAMARHARLLGLRLKDATLRIFGGIPWQAFPHARDDPDHGRSNRMLLAYLDVHYDGEMVRIRDDGAECICISTLAQRQAELAGIGTVRIEWELPLNGAFAYTRHQDPALAGRVRNLVDVVRR